MKKKILLLTITVVLLCSCSRFKFLYNFSYGYIERQVSQYLDQNSADKEFLLLKIRQFMRWHKIVILPRYAKFLEEQADIVDQDQLTKEKIVITINHARQLLADTVVGATPYISAILVRHTSPSKINYIEKQMAEKILEKRKVFLDSGDKLVEKRADKIISGIERFTETLTESQVAIVYAYVADTEMYPIFWLEGREQRQLALIKFLSTQPNLAEIGDFVEKLLLHFDKLEKSKSKEISVEWWARISQFVYELLNSLNTQQRLKLSVSLQGYASDMRALSN